MPQSTFENTVEPSPLNVCGPTKRKLALLRDETRLMTNQILDGTEQTLLTKIQQVNVALKTETDPSRLLTYGSALKTWLEAIDNLRRLKVRD